VTQFISNTHDSETSSQYCGIRLAELNGQYGNRYQYVELDNNKGTVESNQKEADRLANEKSEDDGMIVFLSVTSNAYKRRNLNDIAKQ
jgi:hypothetical protein